MGSPVPLNVEAECTTMVSYVGRMCVYTHTHTDCMEINHSIN